MKFFPFPFLFQITIFLILTEIFLISSRSMHYRCGTNELKIKPKNIKPKLSINEKNPKYKRHLDDVDEDGFKSFNIYIDKNNIKKDLSKSEIKEHEDIILNALDKAAGTLQKLLRVKPISSGIQFSNNELKKIGINSWDSDKFGDKAVRNNIDMKSLGIDLVIFSTLEEMDE